MFIPNKTTILDRVMKDDLNDFHSQYSLGATIESSVNKSVTEADVIYPIDMTKASTNKLLSQDSYCNDPKHPDSTSKAYNCVPLYENVINKILTIEGAYTFKEAIPKILPFIEKAGSNFYGALLRDTEKNTLILNPFHILSAVSNIKLNSKRTYTIILFFYANRSEMDKKYRTSVSDPVLVEQQLDALLHSFGTKVTYKTKLSAMEKHDNGSISLVTASWSDVVSPGALGEENYIVAHQILARGVIAPFYGATALTKSPTGSASGCHITPMRSCNVSDSHRGGGLNNRGTSPVYSSVCTGSQSNSTLAGLRSLTHCNLLSPYSTTTIVEGALAYVDASINKCLQIFKSAGYIQDYKSIAHEALAQNVPSKEEIEAYKNNTFPTYFFDHNDATDFEAVDTRYTEIRDYLAQQRKINDANNNHVSN